VAAPAGVGHRKERSSSDLLVIGAYPDGQAWDLAKGRPDERPRVIENIRRVPLPEADPVHGTNGPLIELWQ